MRILCCVLISSIRRGEECKACHKSPVCLHLFVLSTCLFSPCPESDSQERCSQQLQQTHTHTQIRLDHFRPQCIPVLSTGLWYTACPSWLDWSPLRHILMFFRFLTGCTVYSNLHQHDDLLPRTLCNIGEGRYGSRWACWQKRAMWKMQHQKKK